MKDAWRHFIAEFVGLFMLTFIGGGAIISATNASNGVGLIGVALAHGLALFVAVSATMRISGHINPAVTLGILAARRIDPMMAAVYICAQLLGSVFAVLALKAFVPPDQFLAAHGTIQEIASTVTTGQAVALEAVATFFLTFAVFGTAIDPRGPKIGGLAVGLVITMDILAIGPLTGGSMNPARSFGPAFVTGNWYGQFVYWVGPIIGSVVAALLYEYVLMHHPTEPFDHGELQR
jgi:MIP family channel proteins